MGLSRPGACGRARLHPTVVPLRERTSVWCQGSLSLDVQGGVDAQTRRQQLENDRRENIRRSRAF